MRFCSVKVEIICMHEIFFFFACRWFNIYFCLNKVANFQQYLLLTKQRPMFCKGLSITYHLFFVASLPGANLHRFVFRKVAQFTELSDCGVPHHPVAAWDTGNQHSQVVLHHLTLRQFSKIVEHLTKLLLWAGHGFWMSSALNALTTLECCMVQSSETCPTQNWKWLRKLIERSSEPSRVCHTDVLRGKASQGHVSSKCYISRWVGFQHQTKHAETFE